jgi:hypothetical protein
MLSFVPAAAMPTLLEQLPEIVAELPCKTAIWQFVRALP